MSQTMEKTGVKQFRKHIVHTSVAPPGLNSKLQKEKAPSWQLCFNIKKKFTLGYALSKKKSASTSSCKCQKQHRE